MIQIAKLHLTMKVSKLILFFSSMFSQKCTFLKLVQLRKIEKNLPSLLEHMPTQHTLYSAMGILYKMLATMAKSAMPLFVKSNIKLT